MLTLQCWKQCGQHWYYTNNTVGLPMPVLALKLWYPCLCYIAGNSICVLAPVTAQILVQAMASILQCQQWPACYGPAKGVGIIMSPVGLAKLLTLCCWQCCHGICVTELAMKLAAKQGIFNYVYCDACTVMGLLAVKG